MESHCLLFLLLPTCLPPSHICHGLHSCPLWPQLACGFGLPWYPNLIPPAYIWPSTFEAQPLLTTFSTVCKLWISLAHLGARGQVWYNQPWPGSVDWPGLPFSRDWEGRQFQQQRNDMEIQRGSGVNTNPDFPTRHLDPCQYIIPPLSVNPKTISHLEGRWSLKLGYSENSGCIMVALEGPHTKLKEKRLNYLAYYPSINTIRERHRTSGTNENNDNTDPRLPSPRFS